MDVQSPSRQEEFELSLSEDPTKRGCDQQVARLGIRLVWQGREWRWRLRTSDHAADEPIRARNHAISVKQLTIQPLNSDFPKGIVQVVRDSSRPSDFKGASP